MLALKLLDQRDRPAEHRGHRLNPVGHRAARRTGARLAGPVRLAGLVGGPDPPVPGDRRTVELAEVPFPQLPRADQVRRADRFAHDLRRLPGAGEVR